MLVKCHECSEWISDLATTCPHCGAPTLEGAHKPDRSVCPLCKLRAVEKDYEIEMRRRVKRERVLGGEIEHYEKDKFTIQLCSVCHGKVAKEEAIKAIIMFLGLAGGFVFGFVHCDDWRSALLSGVTFAGLSVLAVSVVVKLLFRGEKRLRHVKAVKEMLERGWDFDG